MIGKYTELAALVILIVVGIPSDALAVRNWCKVAYSLQEESGPVRFRSANILVVIHKGRDLSVMQGFNDLDKPTSVRCHSAVGCILSVVAMVGFNDGDGVTCSLVDGEPIGEPPFPSDSLLTTTLQSRKILQGTHTVQTEVNVANAGQIGSWEVDYTLYDR